MNNIVPMMPCPPKKKDNFWSHLLRRIAEQMKEPLFPIDIEDLLR
jgi:hypothetical protein